MKYLVDTSPAGMQKLQDYPKPLPVAGQLVTPTGRHKNWGQAFAIDNGAYAGLNRKAWLALLRRNHEHKERCLFVTIPDIVRNHRRTEELYFEMTRHKDVIPWTDYWSFVAQDGMEDARINWTAIRHLFIGGSDSFKDSQACYDIVKVAKALAIPVHVGRVNSFKRWDVYNELGCETCDGTGVVKHPGKLAQLAGNIRDDQRQGKLFGKA